MFNKQTDKLKLVAEDKEPIEDTVGYYLVGRFLGRFSGMHCINCTHIIHFG